MTLSDRERVLYARQLLLSEVGPAGQARLFAARAEPSCSAPDSEALAVARDYLTRAGLGRHADQASKSVPIAVPATTTIEGLCKLPEHVPVARALVGALCAVETLKATLELGTPGPTLPTFSLSEEA